MNKDSRTKTHSENGYQIYAESLLVIISYNVKYPFNYCVHLASSRGALKLLCHK